MNKLPNADKAIVPKSKVTDYLLKPEHHTGGSKANFFLRFGFSVAQWEIMAQALLTHAATHPVANTLKTPHCINYLVEGTITTPDNRNPYVRTIWCIGHGEEIPHFVSAYPIKKK